MRRAAGVLVAAVGLVAMVVAVRTSPAELEPAGPNRFVNADRPSLNAHNSPAVAVDPSRPHVIAVADRIDTPRLSCSVSLSTDGGSSWAPLPPPMGGECFWPDVEFDGAGQLLVLSTSLGGPFNQPVGVWLQRFSGATASGAPVKVAGQGAFHARLAVDGARVVAAWVQAGAGAAHKPLGFPPPPNPVHVSRSSDGGRSFSEPVAASEPHRLVAQPSVLLGPGQQVVVGALDLGEDRVDYEGAHEGQGGPPAEGRWGVVVWASTDGGASFGPASVVSDDLVIPQRIYVDLAPAPAFAVDEARGRVYAAWDGGRGHGRDVFVARSEDGGATWSEPVTIAGRPSAQFLPALDVAPDGRVDVVFYDRSRDPGDVMAEVTLASSWDGGRSFSAATVSDMAFDSGIGFGSEQGLPSLGSHLGVVSQPGRAVALWADTRNGSRDDGVQDLAVAVVGISPARSATWPLVLLGAALVGVGAALAVRRAA